MGGYAGAGSQSSLSGGSTDFWRSGSTGPAIPNTSSLKQQHQSVGNISSNSQQQQPPSNPQSTSTSNNSTSLYAAVMAAAAVASWGGQAMPTPTPVSNSLAPSALGKSPPSVVAPTEADAMARRNKSMDASKNPYSSRLVI